MAAILRNHVLYDSADAGTGDWVRLDNRYCGGDIDRALSIYVTAGDTVTIEGIVNDQRGLTQDQVLAAVDETKDVRTLKTYTASDEDVLYGSWTYIRAVKTGTNGAAKVQGMI